jgi:GNAT superfamily N-acetyltransferase
VHFLAGLSTAEALAFWRGVLPGVAEGNRILIVAEAAGRLVGTVQVVFATPPNAQHRADIAKMLVLRAARGRGIGAGLLAAAERAAKSAGRRTLVLDTETGSAGDRLYRRCGWTAVGSIPDFALTTDGSPAAATILYKQV